MQLLILCGGKGTRLKDLTKNTPKPMLEFNKKPFLQYLVEYYRSQGINEFIFSVGYLQKNIIDHFKFGKKFGVSIKYSKEKNPLGTGGAILKAKNILKNIFLVTNGDTFVEIPIKKIINTNTESTDCLGVITVRKSQIDQNSGIVKIGKNGFIQKFTTTEKETKNSYINTGFYLLNKKIFKYFPKKTSSLEKDIFPKICTKLNTFKLNNSYFIDMGTFKTYNKLKKEFKQLENVINNTI